MLRKILACLMAVLISCSALTTVSMLAVESIAVVDPDDRNAVGQLGMLDEEVVDIPEYLLEESSEESESTSEDSSSEESSHTSSVVEFVQKPIAGPIEAPTQAPTIEIPIPVEDPTPPPAPESSAPAPEPSSSPESSAPSQTSSSEPPLSQTIPSNVQPPVTAEETLYVKVNTEPEVKAYPVSEILPKIVAMEMGDAFADEALKAQAVATHSYIKAQNKTGKAPVVAIKNPSTRVRNAVLSVSGLMMYSGGSVISACYCASTGGRTQSSADVWGGYLPYLVSVESAYDYLDPHYGSTKTYTADQVKKFLEVNGGLTVTGDPSTWFTITSYTDGGYVGNMTVCGQTTFVYNGKTYRLNGQNFQTTILRGDGYSALKSSKFAISYANGNFTFTTYGWGHGVGMSQWGAHYYATQGGWNYQQILTHYYQGVSIH